MKKVKIMLLSLALFAVVGGALAFKAKFDRDWCIAPPYGTGSNLYCSFLNGDHITTTQCEELAIGVTNQDAQIFSCTSVPDPDCNALCPNGAKVIDDAP